MKVRSLLAGALVLSLALAVSAAPDNAKKIVGVWKTQGGPAGTLQFTRDGKVKLSLKAGDKTVNVNGTYKVKGDQIAVTLDFMGQTKKDTAKIKKLTTQELQLEKNDGKVETYKRSK